MGMRTLNAVVLIALLATGLAFVGCSRKTVEEADVATPIPSTEAGSPFEASPDVTAPAEGAGEAESAGSPAENRPAEASGASAAKPQPAGEPAAAPSKPAGTPAASGPAGGPPGGPPGGPGGQRGGRGRLFERADANGDGKLTKDEMPERMREHLLEADADGDGAVTREELDAARERGDWGPRGGPGRGGPGARPETEAQ